MLEEKLEDIKKNKDHDLYYILQKYPNPKIQAEGYKHTVSEKEIASRYSKDWYKILNINLLPYYYRKLNLTI